MTELNQRLKEKFITLELTPAALEYAVKQSYDHLCVFSSFYTLPFTLHFHIFPTQEEAERSLLFVLATVDHSLGIA